MGELQAEQAGASASRLATMSRQIADFFRSYPQEQATKSVADHINRFWTPRMRQDLLAMPDAALDPLVASARALVRAGKPAA
ncbi:MAG: formate dehydrogenase subunit delta [Beijerinckiaceae bacterium]